MFKQLLEECRNYLATKAEAKIFENIEKKIKFERDYSFEVKLQLEHLRYPVLSIFYSTQLLYIFL